MPEEQYDTSSSDSDVDYDVNDPTYIPSDDDDYDDTQLFIV